jgi:hypothetical protein
MIREAKRKDLEYKRHATAAFGRFLGSFTSINLFDEVKEIVQDGLEELKEEDENDLQMKPVYLFAPDKSDVDVFYFKQICTLLQQPHTSRRLTPMPARAQSGLSSFIFRRRQPPPPGLSELHYVPVFNCSSENAEQRPR